jgi:sugar phosphate isomerase/epimerase
MLWWGTNETKSREERVKLARKFCLHIEDVHSDFNNMNSIWLETHEGEAKFLELLEEIKDCHKYDISTIVMHLTNGDTPPKISEVGLKRLESIFDLAGQLGITIALENVSSAETLQIMLDKYTDDHIKFCYDTGHEYLWTPDINWTEKYSNRVAAIHLHNNFGENDDHNKLSFGEIDLTKLAQKLRQTNYEGALTIESVYKGEPDAEKLKLFLKEVYKEGKQFLEMLL